MKPKINNRNKITKRSLISTNPLSVTPGQFVESYDAEEYLAIRLTAFDPSHASGLADRQNLINNMYSQVAANKTMKTIDPVEQTAAVNLFIYSWALVQELYAQALIRRMSPKYCAAFGNDTTAIFSTNTWVDLLADLKAMQIEIPSMIIPLVKEMNVAVEVQPFWPENSLVPSYMLYYMPSRASAAIYTLAQTIGQYAQGLDYLRKIGVAFESFDPMSLICEPHVVKPGLSSEWAYLFNQKHNAYFSGGGAYTHIVTQAPYLADAYGGNLGNRKIFWPHGSQPHDLHAMNILDADYHATNNPTGCLTIPSLAVTIPGVAFADHDLGFALVAYTKASAVSSDWVDELAITSGQRIIALFAAALSTTSVSIDSQTDLIEVQSMGINIACAYRTISLTQWQLLCQNFLASRIRSPGRLPTLDDVRSTKTYSAEKNMNRNSKSNSFRKRQAPKGSRGSQQRGGKKPNNRKGGN